jgi:hypothetical protein
MWEYTFAIPALEKLRQNCEFSASLGYISRLCLKKQQKPERNQGIMDNQYTFPLFLHGR